MTASWRTVRVFISSTFKDMQAERDHLVRFVFPKLHEELLHRRIHFVDVDLRWGVTSEQDSLQVCKEIIDECRPRFLCMLGGRYGWTPPGREESITAAEVRYGVLDRLGKHGYAFFYFRDPAATGSMVEARPGEFREPPGSLNKQKLADLKSAITNAGLNPFIYPANWDHKAGRLSGLKAFGDQVYADLMRSIDEGLGEQPPEKLDEFAEEDAAMEAFVEERTERFVLGSRESVLKKLLAHARATGGNGYFCVTGAPGSGKSALFAHLYRCLQTPATGLRSSLVIAHFVGASPGSTDVRRTLRRLCHELTRGYPDFAAQIPDDPGKLRAMLLMLLRQACAHQHVVILLDAINQFDLVSHSAGLRWLPDELPSAARVILSALDGPALEELRRRPCKPRETKLKPFTAADGEAIIEQFHQRYHKRFESEQRASLLAKTGASTPLYLLAALEELRTLGTYEEITRRIVELPPTMQGLFAWILERLENDDGFRDASGRRVGHELVSHFAALLGASRYGLSHHEFADLLDPGDPQGNIAALLQLLRPYLMRRGELLDFYHDQLRDAVDGRYSNKDRQLGDPHQMLAAYFEGRWRALYLRALSELPYHQTRARLWLRVVDTLTEYDFVEAKVAAGMTFALVRDCNAADHALSAAHLEEGLRKRLQDWRNFISISAHRLARLEEPFLQIAYNYADAGPVSRAAEQKALHHRECWLRCLNRPTYDERLGCVRVLEAHGGGVSSLAITPDGRMLLTTGMEAGGGDDRVKTWDLDTGECLAEAPLRGLVRAVTLTEEGRLAIMGGGEYRKYGVVTVLDVQTGQIVRSLEGHALWVNALAVTSDGRIAISASEDATLRAWNIQQGTCLHVFAGHNSSVNSVAITRDDELIVSGSKDKSIRIWNGQTGECKRVLRGHRSAVTQVNVLPDDRRIISSSWDRTLRVWNVETGKCIRILRGHSARIWVLIVTPDGRRVVSGSEDGTLFVWDLETLSCMHRLSGLEAWVEALAVTRDNSIVIAGGREPCVRSWSIETGERLQVHRGHHGSVGAIAVVPGRPHVVSAGETTVRVWDLMGQVQLRNLEGHREWVTSASVSPDGRLAVSASIDRTLRVWNLDSGECLRTLRGHSDQVRSVSVMPDGRHAVSGSADGTLRVWDLDSGMCQQTLEAHSGKVMTMTVTADGRHAVFAGLLDPTLRVWNLESSNRARAMEGHSLHVAALAAIPDARRIVSCSQDRSLILWDVSSGVHLKTLKGHRYAVSAVAALPDARRIISTSLDSTLRVWDLQSGACQEERFGHEFWDAPVAALPNGRWIASGSLDGTLRLWNLKPWELMGVLDVDGCISAIAVGPDGRRLLVGDRNGRLLIVALQNVRLGAPHLTAWYLAEAMAYAFGCPLCGTWSEISGSALGTEMACPNCGEVVELNPFKIEGDWRPIAKAWRGE